LPRPDAHGAGAADLTDRPVPPRADALDRARPVVHALGRALHALTVYGFEHRGAARTIADTFDILRNYLLLHARLNMAVAGDELLIDGVKLATGIPLIRLLAQRMKECELTSVSLVVGMSAAEFESLLRALTPRPGQPKSADRWPSSSHVIAERVTFVKVRDGDTVIRQEEAGTLAAVASQMAAQGRAAARRPEADVPPAAPRSAPPAMPSAAPPAPAEKDAAPKGDADAGRAADIAASAEVVAFVQGTAAPGARPPEALTELTKDAQRLGELILRVAVARGALAAGESGESIEDVVIACLQRTIDGLLAGADSETPRGRTQLRRALMELERSLTGQMKEALGVVGPAAARRLRQSVASALGGLEAEQLVREAKQARLRLEQVERRLLHYVDRAIEQGGEDRVRRSLIGVGLSEDDWQEILATRTPESPAAAEGATASLADTARRLDDLVKRLSRGGDEARAAAAEAREAVVRAVEAGERTLDALPDRLAGVRSSRRGGASAHRIFLETLAEIAQEILQPLSVIHLCLEMTSAELKAAGASDVVDLLNLAREGTEKLKTLAGRLVSQVGYPRSLYTNRELAYGPPSKKPGAGA